MADLSNLSDDELKALYADDYKKLSDESLKALSAQMHEEKTQKEEAQAVANPPVNKGPVAPTSLMDQAGDVATNVVGGLQTAGEFAVENPKTAAAITELGLAALPQSVASKIPLVNQASQLAKLPFKAIPAGIEAANAYSGSKNAQALAQMEHQIRQYAKAGQPVPQQLQQAVDAMRSRVAGPVAPAGAPVSAPVKPPVAAPTQAAPSMANRVQAAAAQRISNLPAMGEMLGAAGRVAGRILGPASLALQTTDLGPKTPQTGRMRGSEINPLTGRPWTPEQIAQYESNPQMFDAQLAQPQFRR